MNNTVNVRYREDSDFVMNVRAHPTGVCQGPLVKGTEGRIPQSRWVIPQVNVAIKFLN